MPLDNVYAGAADVGSYQLSAVPFVTSSAATEIGATPIRVALPSVSRFIVVHNISSNVLRFGFTENGVKGEGASVSGSQIADQTNYFILSGNQTTDRLELRCKELWFAQDAASPAGFSLLAGLAPVRPSQFPTLTGSAGYMGVG